MKKSVIPRDYSQLIADLASLIEQGHRFAARSVNTTLVMTYGLIGRRIVEYEQKGKKRAEYGEEILPKLSADLSKKFGRGFSPDNLEAMRRFYLVYEAGISATLSRKSLPLQVIRHYADKFVLSWSHYRLLLRLDESDKREFYERECIQGNWSVRQLDRQIQSLLYERTTLSKRKTAVIAKAHENPIIIRPEDEIKDPYVLEFLGLKDEYSESQLEEALIHHLEEFLLELGIGFTFVARQKRITIGRQHFRLDLLLYHRVLKCLVAIDLKLGEFSHADAGQMNLYLNYLRAKELFQDENDAIGLIRCSDRDHTVVEYALGGMSNKIFASKYKLLLPDPETLKVEIEREKQKLLEMKIEVPRK
jgi:predicted nuclease of restriction endonuclease-like (RecB) superfamily